LPRHEWTKIFETQNIVKKESFFLKNQISAKKHISKFFLWTNIPLYAHINFAKQGDKSNITIERF